MRVHEAELKGIDNVVLCYECYSKKGEMSSKKGIMSARIRVLQGSHDPQGSATRVSKGPGPGQNL